MRRLLMTAGWIVLLFGLWRVMGVAEAQPAEIRPASTIHRNT